MVPARRRRDIDACDRLGGSIPMDFTATKVSPLRNLDHAPRMNELQNQEN